MLAALLGVWGALVLANAFHQPYSIEYALRFFFPPQMAGWAAAGFAGAAGRNALGLLRLAALDAAFLWLGFIAIAAVAPRLSGRLRIHVALIAGQAAASFAVAGLGAAGLASTGFLRALVVLPAAALLLALFRKLPRLSIPSFRSVVPDGAASLLLFFGSLAVLTALMGALAPQTSYDALTYYYAWPHRVLEHHRWTSAPYVPYDGFPHSFEALFALAFSVGDEVTAKLLNWQAFAMACLAMNGMMEWRGVPPAGRALAVSAFATLPISGHLAMVTYNDCAVTHGATVAAWLLLSGRRGAAAALAGWLMALKYSAVVVSVPLVLLAAWPLITGRGLCRLAVASAAILPHWTWNWLFHAYPLYPLFWNACPTFENAAVLDPTANVAGFLPRLVSVASVADLAALPWWAHLGPAKSIMWEFSARAVSPASLWLIPAALLLGRGTALKFSLAAFVLWGILSGGLIRFLLPALPVLLMAAAEGTGRLGMLRPACVMATAFVALQSIFNWAGGYERVNPAAVVMGAETPSQHLRRIVGPIPHYMDIAGESERLFRGGRTYVLGDVKAYYWTGDFILDVIPIQPWLSRWLAESASVGGLRARFRQMNVRHVAYRLEGLLSMQNSSPRAYPWDARRLALWQSFWGRHAEFRGESVSPDGTYYYFFDIVSRPRTGWRRASVPFTFPGTESLTAPCDTPLLDGKAVEARRCFERLARQWPGFAVSRKRLDADIK